MTQNGIPEIAVIVAGTDEEYQSSILSGITQAAKELNISVAIFASFGGVLASNQYDIGEYNIYFLAQFNRFDGAILLTNTIMDEKIRRKVCESVRDAGIPTVVFDNSDIPDFYNIRIDNNSAMYKIVEHVISVHNAKIVNYISGPLANPEARARFETFCDVMHSHGLKVEEDRVYMGTFRPIDGKHAAEKFLASGLPLPDAIVCANDAMALEAVSALEEHGIRVPEDIIVTGFDFTYYAQHHSPSLSTVARPLFNAGKAACELIVDILNGEECEKELQLNAHPVYEESCGCVGQGEIDIRSYKKSTYSLLKTGRADVSLLNRMTSALAISESPEENIRIISQYLQEIDCEQCCICLCENWESAFDESQRNKANYQIYGYTENMIAPLIWTRGEITARTHFRCEELYPCEHGSESSINYFFPLHFRERCLGYYIFTNTDFPIKSMLCQSLMMNISNSFENIRKLIHLNNAIHELDRMYVADPLCEIYNRNGFIRLADECFDECRKQNKRILISFIDMDGLKFINDTYGHEEGDFALKQLAAVIQESCFGDQICARFGGDEFIAVGSSTDESDGAAFEEGFRKHLAEANETLGKPYKLDASIGTLVTAIEPEMKLFALISHADQLMYEQKKKHHNSRYLQSESKSDTPPPKAQNSERPAGTPRNKGKGKGKNHRKK